MKRITMAYQPKYGSTGQHTQQIARDSGTELLERSAVLPAFLRECNVVVYGGGLYAGGIAGVNLVAKYPCPPPVVFTVGLANPAITDRSEILNRNFSPEQREKLKVFHLCGTMDYGRLGSVHRGMIAVMKKMTVDPRAPEKQMDEDRLMLEAYGKFVDFTEEALVAPLVEHVRGLL